MVGKVLPGEIKFSFKFFSARKGARYDDKGAHRLETQGMVKSFEDLRAISDQRLICLIYQPQITEN